MQLVLHVHSWKDLRFNNPVDKYFQSQFPDGVTPSWIHERPKHSYYPVHCMIGAK